MTREPKHSRIEQRLLAYERIRQDAEILATLTVNNLDRPQERERVARRLLGWCNAWRNV